LKKKCKYFVTQLRKFLVLVYYKAANIGDIKSPIAISCKV